MTRRAPFALCVALLAALGPRVPADDPPASPGADALGPPISIGLRGVIEGEHDQAALARLTVPLPGRAGGMLSAPGDPRLFLSVPDALERARDEGLDEALRPLLWPEGSPPSECTLRVFIQGLNTPREDGADIGADARLRRYLEQGYLSAPVLALHNATALEEPTGAPAPRVSATGAHLVDIPLGGDALTAARERLPDLLLPARRRDFYRAARLRVLGFGAREGEYVTQEIASLAALVEAGLDPRATRRLHVIAYSDGTLIAEHGVRLAAERLARRLAVTERLTPGEARSRVEALLRERAFLEYWGNATALLVRGPRRLLVHDRRDHVTGQRLPGGGTFGTLTAADVPAALREDTAIVTFESPWTTGDEHNALAAIGPALRAMQRLELGEVDPSRAPVRFDAAPTLRLWRALKGRGLVERTYSVQELDVDYDAVRSYLWRT